MLGTILSFAVTEAIIDANPASGVRRPSGTRRDRRLNAEDFASLGQALRSRLGPDAESWRGPAIIMLTALTGFRVGEAEQLKRSEVDFERQLAILADSKTGRSIRPLGKSALDLLRALPSSPSDYFFPAPRLADRAYAGTKRAYRTIFSSADMNGVTPHVLRHSFASVAAELGYADSTIGACLGHVGRGITSRYTHLLDTVIIAAADRISAEIQKMMTTDPHSKPAN